jgi:gamma-glutamyltranspeptidase
VQILERGGNAVDAAIAANAVMGVVGPEMNGIGGDLFAIVYEARTGAARTQRQRMVSAGCRSARSRCSWQGRGSMTTRCSSSRA